MASKADPAVPTAAIQSFGGRRVLFQMAARAEYGGHLKAMIDPLFTGVGPVEAGVVMGTVLARLELRGDLPDLVVSLGSAGSRRLERARVYQASSVSYRDMDASPLGFAKGQTPFLDLPPVVEIPLLIPDLPAASLSTGADIISGAAYDAIAADMVDMETYAVLRACQLFRIPLVALRGISDGAEELGHVDDWTRYLDVVDKNLAIALKSLQQTLQSR